MPAEASFRKQIKALCDLFALTQLESELGAFLEDGFISTRQASFVRAQARGLLAVIRYGDRQRGGLGAGTGPEFTRTTTQNATVSWVGPVPTRSRSRTASTLATTRSTRHSAATTATCTATCTAAPSRSRSTAAR